MRNHWVQIHFWRSLVLRPPPQRNPLSWKAFQVFFSGLFVEVYRALLFQPLDAYSQLCSILRSSSFKTHLKKHGLDPSKYAGFSSRDHSPVEVWQSKGIKDERVSSLQISSYFQDVPLRDLPYSWDQFFSLPADTSDPLVMQPGLASGVSCSSPLLLAPTPRVATDYNAGYFLSPPRASPAISSSYSSPMARTPVLTPERGLEFVGDVAVQLSPCLETTQDWTLSAAWQDHGIQFVGG